MTGRGSGCGDMDEKVMKMGRGAAKSPHEGWTIHFSVAAIQDVSRKGVKWRDGPSKVWFAAYL